MGSSPTSSRTMVAIRVTSYKTIPTDLTGLLKSVWQPCSASDEVGAQWREDHDTVIPGPRCFQSDRSSPARVLFGLPCAKD